MNITFNELRELKHKLPTGSIKKIADTLKLDEQTVSNYFGAENYEEGDSTGNHRQPGPNGGIVHIEDTRIIDLAYELLEENN